MDETTAPSEDVTQTVPGDGTVPTAPPEKPGDDPEDLNKSIAKYLKERMDGSKDQIKQFLNEWQGNVERRMGRTTISSFASAIFTSGVPTDDDSQAEINPDWSLTKTKTANLYSQVPTVQLTHENKIYGPAVSPFQRSINYELSEKRAHVSTAMNEVFNDVVNAAGIGAVECGYTARFEPKQVPVEDTIPGPQGPLKVATLPPELLQKLVQAGVVHMKEIQSVVSDKLYVTRFSPTDLLVPREFTGSNFDDADYVGRKGRISWAEGKSEFKLDEADKKELLDAYSGKDDDNLRAGNDRSTAMMNVRALRYNVIYYWRHRFDPDEKHFDAIWKLVFLDGKSEPVIHEQWKGQELDEQSKKYVGALKFPIRILTLTYITDNPIPPSDTAAGRPQVDDMRRSRQQMFQNRERSLPMRWFDVNRVDPLIQQLLMNGTWQGMIPCNGPGDKTFGEVARASYPSEDLAFDNVCKQDLLEAWHIGPNQQGVGSSRQTKSQVENVQANFATVMGQERAATARFFLGIVEVLSGLMALYSDFPLLAPDERAAMEKAWDHKHILHDLAFNILPDSTILLDAPAQLAKLSQFLNLTVKSGFVNPLPIIIKMAELSGLDPAEVVIQPQPKGPEDPNLSFRFAGKDDLMNPMVAGMLAKHKQLPTPEEMAAGKKALRAAQSYDDDTPPSPEGAQAPPGAKGAAGLPPPNPAAPKGAHEGWVLGSRIAKRSRDVNG